MKTVMKTRLNLVFAAIALGAFAEAQADPMSEALAKAEAHLKRAGVEQFVGSETDVAVQHGSRASSAMTSERPVTTVKTLGDEAMDYSAIQYPFDLTRDEYLAYLQAVKQRKAERLQQMDKPRRLDISKEVRFLEKLAAKQQTRKAAAAVPSGVDTGNTAGDIDASNTSGLSQQIACGKKTLALMSGEANKSALKSKPEVSTPGMCKS